jgi:hypothetical protein
MSRGSDSRQWTAAADSRQQTADSRQQTSAPIRIEDAAHCSFVVLGTSPFCVGALLLEEDSVESVENGDQHTRGQRASGMNTHNWMERRRRSEVRCLDQSGSVHPRVPASSSPRQHHCLTQASQRVVLASRGIRNSSGESGRSPQGKHLP